MNCPRCSADLLDSATFCPQCGTTIRQTGFSYLPAGTPPWPGTLPENTPNAATATMSHPQVGDGTAARTKAKRSVGSMLLTFVLLVLSIVIGVGGTLGILAASGQFATPATTKSSAIQAQPQSTANPADTSTSTSTTPTTQGNQLPTPSSFQTAKVAEVALSLKYPGDWVEEPPSVGSNGTGVDFHPSQQLPIDLHIERFSANTSSSVTSTSEVNQGITQSFGTQQSLTNLQILTNTPPHRTIGGITWDEQDTTFTLGSNSGLLHFVSISVKHNALYYNIFYFAPTAIYDEAMQKYYSQMLDSLKFTS